MSTCLLNNVLRLDPKLSAKLNPKLHTRTVMVTTPQLNAVLKIKRRIVINDSM